MNRALIQWAAWAALLGATLFPFGAAAADSYPSRPVKIIVPFGPGTGSDVLARTLSAKLSDALGEQVTVENREGAGGLIGAKAVLDAAADGYTLMLAANPFVVNPLLYEKAPYDPVKDFAPVAKIAVVPSVLLVHPTVGPQTMNTLIAQAKAAPGSLFYASSGKGTLSELEMELLKSMYGIDLVEVPYKNTGQAMTELIAGQVQLYYPTLPAALPTDSHKTTLPVRLRHGPKVSWIVAHIGTFRWDTILTEELQRVDLGPVLDDGTLAAKLQPSVE